MGFLETKYHNSLGKILDVSIEFIELKKDRLSKRISEFEDLAKYSNYQEIKNNKGITDRLQDAWDIMHDTHYPKIWRCRPCEFEALCAIKDIVGNTDVPVFFDPKYINIEWQ